MGTYIEYCNHEMDGVSSQCLNEFSSRMIKVLNYGGMMDFDTVSMYGHRLHMLKSPLNYAGETISFFYNYFEDDYWETAEYDTGDHSLMTMKVGEKEFNRVVQAAYTLYELYDTEPGFVSMNSYIVDIYEVAGWMNHLLGTEFTLQHRIDGLWELAEKQALTRVEEGRRTFLTASFFAHNELWDIVSLHLLKYSGGTDIADLCYIAHGTETLCADDIEPGTYPADVWECRSRLVRYIKGKGNVEAAVTEIRKMVCMDREDRQAPGDDGLREVAEMTMFLPARVILYLTAEISGSEFWVDWKDLKDCVYHDEHGKVYASPELLRQRQEMRSRPIPGISTSDYLREDDWYTFKNNTQNKKNAPEYYVSDDDRLYWWDGSDEVVMSDEMDSWLRELAERHRKIMSESSGGDSDDGKASEDFLKEFFSLLEDIEKYYKRVFPFQEMFYEFIQNGHRIEFEAAVELLRQLSEENREAGSAIKSFSGRWEWASRKVAFNPGRLRMKRYLSLMANRKLRKQYFGF